MVSITLSTKDSQDGSNRLSSPEHHSEGVPRNGSSFFTMMSLHINNHVGKKRGIGKKFLPTVRTVMLQEQVDMVAGDFNGAAWRRQAGSDPRPILNQGPKKTKKLKISGEK